MCNLCRYAWFLQAQSHIITSCNNTIGVTVWEILTFGARPYPNLKASEVLMALQNGVRLKQPDTCTLDLYAILLKCMFCFSIFEC